MNQGPPPSEFARAAYAEAMASQFAEQFGTAMPFGFAQQLESMFGQAAQHQAQPQTGWSEEKAAPAISQAALRKLPLVKVTEEDLCVDGNDTCVVCLEPQKVGDSALRLPCGHLYHKDCIVEWLRKHCTCPNCRYELPSDDPAFERGREARMRERKPRYRLRELEKMSATDLRQLLRDRGGLPGDERGESKEDLIRRLVEGGLVDVVKEPPPLSLRCDEAGLRSPVWTAKHLKHLMRRVGVDSTRCLEKPDLVDHLLASGRVCLADDVVKDDKDKDDDELKEADDHHRRAREALDAFLQDESQRQPLSPVPGDSSGSASSSSSSYPDSKRQYPQPMDVDDVAGFTADDIMRMSVRELKAELVKRGREEDVRSSVEKADLRRALARALGVAL
eukprot:CAMPEP_0118900800 /NCGR_PEP_ID=MMETSP1166-20130328/6759_1 /TAXON_ID=1104430 /ORGANISM="Chrysoreinhardia sp, Strain CCMP3193" /LENGTH=390 /DNA_ID=CAMNT_0006839953 /DNA_START=68 /DNA_END=1240 /DNA_ORIENTATION=+